MRTFPGGYKKSSYDKQMELKAARHAQAVSAQFNAEMKKLNDEIEQKRKEEENEKNLRKAAELMDRYNQLKAAS